MILKKKRVFERKNVDGDIDGKIHANVKNTTRDFSVKESCSSTETSIQNMIQEFTTVVFEKDELEFRDISELKSILPPLAYQDSNSDVEIKFWDT